MPSVSFVGSPFIPPPPAQPTFGPQSAPYGFSQSSLLNSPPPPQSLSPVAMGSDRSYGGVSATGTNPQSIAPRDKPSFKWGIMIAISGAVVGALLGLGWDAKRSPTVSAASQAIATQSVANSLSAPQAAPPVVAAPPPVAVAAAVPPMNDSSAVPPGVIAPPAPQTKAEKRAAAKAAAAAAAADRADRIAAAKEAAASAAPPPKRQSFFAAKVTAPPPVAAPTPRPVAVAAPPPPPVVEKPAAPAKLTKAEKAAAAAAAKADNADKKAGSGEARQTLEDAIKDTTNTL